MKMKIKRILFILMLVLCCCCSSLAENAVVGYYDFLTDELENYYIEPTIVCGNGFGPWDGRPDDDKGVYAVCIRDSKSTFYLSIFEKETDDEKYMLSSELNNVSYRGILPTNICVEFYESISSQKYYTLTYGYDTDEAYIQVECHSLIGSKTWEIKKFSVRYKKAKIRDIIEFTPITDGGIAVYTNVPSGVYYKNHPTVSYFYGDTEYNFPTDFSEINIESLLSLLYSIKQDD